MSSVYIPKPTGSPKLPGSFLSSCVHCSALSCACPQCTYPNQRDHRSCLAPSCHPVSTLQLFRAHVLSVHTQTNGITEVAWLLLVILCPHCKLHDAREQEEGCKAIGTWSSGDC